MTEGARPPGAVALALILGLAVCGPLAAAEETTPAAADAGFSVLPRADALEFQPCSTCHQHLPANPTPRQLFAPHPVELDHGDDRIWCLNCHHPDQRDVLADALGNEVSFDAAPEVCATCHQARHRDWTRGGHGKRDANWRGERRLYSCTHCHDPHAPAIATRAPAPPPRTRFDAAAEETSR